MDNTGKSSCSWVLFSGLVGASISGFGYPFLVFFFNDELYRNTFEVSCNSLECVSMVHLPFWGCCMFGLVLGGICGLIGTTIARTIHQELGMWIGAIIGGLIALLIIAFLVMQV